MYCSAAALGQNSTREHLCLLLSFLFLLSGKKGRHNGLIKKKKCGEEEDAEGDGAGEKGSWGVAVVHMDFSPFLHSPHYLSHLPGSCSFSFLRSLIPPSSLVLLSLPLSLFLALAGHAAAAELFGSLDFMVAALPLSNDGLVNSNLH